MDERWRPWPPFTMAAQTKTFVGFCEQWRPADLTILRRRQTQSSQHRRLSGGRRGSKLYQRCAPRRRRELEILMQHPLSGPSLSPPGRRLRFVFRDAEMRFDLGGGATFEDVGGKPDDPAAQGSDRPVAVS